jgi:hypothetical protein
MSQPSPSLGGLTKSIIAEKLNLSGARCCNDNMLER